MKIKPWCNFDETGQGVGRGIKIPANTLIAANRTAKDAAATGHEQYRSFLSGMKEKDLVKQITGEKGGFGRYLIDHGGVPIGSRSVTGDTLRWLVAEQFQILFICFSRRLVINKKSAQRFGYDNLKKINGYAQGGVVRDGVQHFSNGGITERLSGAFSGENISKQLKATGIQVKDLA